MSDRIVNQEPVRNEREHEAQLRPQNFQEFIGQNKVVDNIDLMVKSAIVRKAAMDHVLLSGPPGLGNGTDNNKCDIQRSNGNSVDDPDIICKFDKNLRNAVQNG